MLGGPWGGTKGTGTDLLQCLVPAVVLRVATVSNLRCHVKKKQQHKKCMLTVRATAAAASARALTGVRLGEVLSGLTHVWLGGG